MIYEDTSKDISKSEEEEIPPIPDSEAAKALNEMKNNKAPGENNIVIEMIKVGEVTIKKIKELFNLILTKENVLTNWKNALIIILFTNGNMKDLTNYRPICLLSHIHKLFVKNLKTELTKI